MSRLRKYYPHNSLISVTFRLEEGLSLVALKFIELIIMSCLAMAKRKYPVNVIDFNFEPNHPHMILRVLDPQDVARFLGYLKQEISHRLNRLLGKRKKTNWCKGYTSPVILDKEKFLHELAYGLTNPVKDNLVASIDEYPGVSSWKMLRDKTFLFRCRYTKRDKIPRLRDPSRPWREEKIVLKSIARQNTKELTFELSPYSWKHCFADTKDLSDEEVHKIMVSYIREVEKKHQEEFAKTKKLPLGREALRHQSMLKSYVPKKYGRKMICLSTFKELRMSFISKYKELSALAREVFERWKIGDYSIPFPPGLFAPPPPRLAESLPRFY